MSRLAPGTPVQGPYASYTAEQLVALEGMKDPRFTLGIARAEFANTVLHPDGSHSADVEAVLLAARERLTTLLAGDLTDPKTLGDAQRAAAFVQEVATHIEQARFLFIVNADGLPVVYFQVAVEANPDTPPLVEDHEAHAAHRAEVTAAIARVVDEAIAAAKEG